MSCDEVQNALAAYLDKELSPAVQQPVQQHLSCCQVCRAELAGLVAARRRVQAWLQQAAADAAPSPQAWDNLQDRLVEEMRPLEASPSSKSPLEQAAGAPLTTEPRLRHAHLSRVREAARLECKALTSTFRGGKTMPKRIWLTALMAVIVIAAAVLYTAQNATPVSAQQVLERAATAQNASGIRHEQVEVYTNAEALPGDGAGTRTILDSYLDLQSGIFRQVITDASGKVLGAFGYDGTFTYSSQEGVRSEPGASLPVYRVPQSKDQVADLRPGAYVKDDQQLFDSFRSSHQVEMETVTWSSGRLAYILTTRLPVKVLVGGQVQTPAGVTTMVFDARSYQLLESSSRVEMNGQEVVIVSNRYQVSETLPAGTAIPWDFSDLKGITLIDDQAAQFGYLLPEKVQPQEMANLQGLVLSHTPEGFVQQVSTPGGGPEGQPLAYIVNYTDSAGNFFSVQTFNGPSSLPPALYNDETYTTAAGLVLHFSPAETKPGGVQVTAALITAPDGARYSLTSSLPQEQVKAWAEDLVKTVG